MIVIGVDCASDEKRVGLAYGSIESEKPTIHKVAVGGGNESVAELIVKWLPKGQPALLALDAPLGWPTDLASELLDHSAGVPLRVPPDHLFSRLTDHVVKESIGKRPFEVGADRIARTAYMALSLLQCLREKTGLAIPLVWKPNELGETCAIEVYPAATLIVHGINVRGYKKPNARDIREKLVERLSHHVEVATERERLESSPDAIDAAVCVLAAYDFWLGKCIQPSDEERARKEGWIWVRYPGN